MDVALACISAGCLLLAASGCSARSAHGPLSEGGSATSSRPAGVPSSSALSPAPGPLRTAVAAVTLSAAPSPYGSILATGDGQTLYALSTETGTDRTCTGRCQGVWPLLVVSGPVVPGPGVRSDLVGPLRAPDGSASLTYGGHPLHTFRGDRQPGQINGQAARTGTGIWLVVSAASGQPVRTAPGGPSPGA